ncbi:uroporphyrinogen-III C-methyltransferase [Kyrpidia spormannii]|uniref:Uroporphyrinogen-III C-methyltransferase n=1 Tax=Kyrpidia spormannii TaxID=2055160 RepID=A0A6F9E6H6_9BACL|nr:uroporphyrinogen-III C-methyltransferase [Kyrpidia spormannii]CAB3391877.1 Uroporphyrinogen-III C-methyltransferase [Kyrpidia spormannii]
MGEGEGRTGKPGTVYLVGAGPGDPGLITVKGMECLKKADAVVYDRLASPRLLRYLRPDAERIYVGKAEGRHTLTQDEIQELLVRLAQDGKTVVRLKGGDPFVFGRGGEEAEFLVEHGIPFEVVPGVTSAVAVPAYAGIPVTHRDHTPSFAVVTGHEDPEKETSWIDWDRLSTGVGTLIFLMGVGRLAGIVEQLTAHGRPGTTPVALIRWGTRMEQETVTGTLDTIVDEVRRRNFRSPAVIVVGEVVGLRERLNWFERKPLFGKRILVTRAREQASALSAQIQDLGGEAVEFPAIRIEPPASWADLDEALTRSDLKWIVLTSRHAVESVWSRMRALELDVRRLSGVRMAAVGPATAEALRERGVIPELTASEYRGQALAETLVPHIASGDVVLLPRSNLASRDVPEVLSAAGAAVVEAEAYRTEPGCEGAEEVRGLLREGRIHAVTFTSSSTVRFFLQGIGEEARPWLEHVPAFCIGPVTAATARELGLKVAGVAEQATVDSLVDLLAREMEAGAIRNGG